MAKIDELLNQKEDAYADGESFEMDELLYSRRAELKNIDDLMAQRGTTIPALFQHYYKFIQNPSSVSVETYKRMVDTDDTVGSGCDFLSTCLAARLGKYTHPSKEVADFINLALEGIRGGWIPLVKEMLSAPWAGFYTGEKVWVNKPQGFLIGEVIPLPPTTVLFEVERGGRLTPDGILQYQRNWNPVAFSQGIGFFGGITSASGWVGPGGAPDPFARFGDLAFPLRTANTFNYLSVRIPTAKCVHYAFNAQGGFGNPYGRSLLRRCYKYYVLKDAILRMMSTALDRKGTPLTVVFADPNTTVIDERKLRQNGGTARGNYVGQRADDAAREVFKNVHNDSVIILPGKKDQIYSIEQISSQSNVSDFISALQYCDRGILRALLIPALIFSSGDGTGSYALGDAHAKTFDKICDSHLSGFKDVAQEQIVRDLLMFNFPRSAWEKDGLGEFGKRELTQDEKQKELETLSTLNDMGGMDMQDLDDLNQAREKAGMTPRSKPIPQDHLPGANEEEDAGDDNKKGESNEE